MTFPALPFFPRWMWACVALPLRPLKVSVYFSFPPVVSVPAKVPLPEPPIGLGTSWPGTSVAESL
jgi:hypothetical protein